MSDAIQAGASTITVSWPYGPDSVPKALTDATMTSIVDLARAGTGDDIRPMRIERRGELLPTTSNARSAGRPTRTSSFSMSPTSSARSKATIKRC